MKNKCMEILINDLRQYKYNLLSIKVSRGIFIVFFIAVLMPRDVLSFLRLLSGSAEFLFYTSNFKSFVAVFFFNVLLIFAFLIQIKILPPAYRTNYISSIFDELSVSMSRALFFIITNWFVLAWLVCGLSVSPRAVGVSVILGFVFIVINVSFLLSLMHEKQYVMIPIVFVHVLIFSYFRDSVFISLVNISILCVFFILVYKRGFKLNGAWLGGLFFTNIFRNYIRGPFSLRLAIMVRKNLLMSFGLTLCGVIVFGMFYSSLSSGTDRSLAVLSMYTLSLAYLISFVYAKLSLERRFVREYLYLLSPKLTEIKYDFLFIFIIFEIAQVCSLLCFPVSIGYFYFLCFCIFPIIVLSVFCFVSTVNSRYSKIYLFVVFGSMIWLTLWIF